MTSHKKYQKKTKIICTIGPSSASEKVILDLIQSGMDLARLNFSHGDHDSHKKTYDLLRDCEIKSGKPLGILADLQGPKIRTGSIKGGSIELQKDQVIEIYPDPELLGDETKIGCTYLNLLQDLSRGEKVLIDDGKLVLSVESVESDHAKLKVRIPGTLKDHKGMNLPGTPISAPALSEKDKKDLEFALALGVDYIALSFVRSAADLDEARALMKGNYAGLIAKIERPEAVKKIHEIIQHADGIMIARGDLGVELETERIPILQKEIIFQANRALKPVITATQMLESMIENPRPTRAEATDVANAVIDGTDAVMLSGESASGKYPVESTAIMTKILEEAENIDSRYEIHRNLEKTIEEIEKTALGNAAKELAHGLHCRAIVNFTRTGYSAMVSAEMRPKVPIYSFTPFLTTARKMKLYRGVFPYVMPIVDKFQDMINFMNKRLKEEKLIKSDDTVVILSSAPGSVPKSVDFLQIYRIK